MLVVYSFSFINLRSLISSIGFPTIAFASFESSGNAYSSISKVSFSGDVLSF